MIIIVYFCLASLPSIVYGQNRGNEKTLDELLNTVNAIAANGRETINGVFKPSINGFLGKGSIGFTYKGKLLPSNKEVAMKFILAEDLHGAEREYTVYTCLGSINDTKVESFGVPTVYYYGRWHGHAIIALTLLDSAFNSKFESKELNDADIMIIFRELVRIIKYIHSRGISHKDIFIGNIMFNKHHGFIIDYNAAIQMYEVNEYGLECAMRDLKYFLAVMCRYYGFEYDCKSYDRTASRIIERIKNDGLKRIYLELATVAFKTKVPNYNKIVEVINEEINRCTVPKTQWFSWLTDDQRREAGPDLLNNLTSILSIGDPFQNNVFNYPEVNFNYFG